MSQATAVYFSSPGEPVTSTSPIKMARKPT